MINPWIYQSELFSWSITLHRVISFACIYRLHFLIVVFNRGINSIYSSATCFLENCWNVCIAKSCSCVSTAGPPCNFYVNIWSFTHPALQFKFFLPIPDPPRFLFRPEPQYLRIPGQDVTMICGATGKPVPNIQWRKVGHMSLAFIILSAVK